MRKKKLIGSSHTSHMGKEEIAIQIFNKILSKYEEDVENKSTKDFYTIREFSAKSSHFRTVPV